VCVCVKVFGVTVMHADAVYVAVNGIDGSVRRCEPHSESSSSEDQELEEERRIVREQLSKLPTPKVRLSRLLGPLHRVWQLLLLFFVIFISAKEVICSLSLCVVLSAAWTNLCEMLEVVDVGTVSTGFYF